MTWSNDRHTLASIFCAFLHSAPNTNFRKGCFSAAHFRFRNKNSTLCSNTTLGLKLNSNRGTAVCRKSQKTRSKCLQAASFSTAERKWGGLHFAIKHDKRLHWFAWTSYYKSTNA